MTISPCLIVIEASTNMVLTPQLITLLLSKLGAPDEPDEPDELEAEPEEPEPSNAHTSLISLQQSLLMWQNSSQKHATIVVPG